MICIAFIIIATALNCVGFEINLFYLILNCLPARDTYMQEVTFTRCCII